jgi:hypothetical protein
MVPFVYGTGRGFSRMGAYFWWVSRWCQAWLTGAFDGLTYYQEVGGDEIAILPKLDKQGMFRGILGYRAEKAAIEFSYERANHNGTFGEGERARRRSSR